jgi:hypothetical protein
LGIKTGGYSKIFSSIPFNAVEISHINGNKESTDIKIRKK